jgi:hypothetical protein
MSKKKSPAASAAPTNDTGFAAMLAGAQKGDHVVLADWVQENLQFDDLAACLRASQDDPRTGKQKDQTVFTGFRYRQLDRHVLLFAVQFRVYEWSQPGKKTKTPEGHAICLCLSADAPKGPSRLVRWLPKEARCPALKRLWDDLGKGRPAEPEE